MRSMKVGFIGLGTMGLPMTRNLIQKGWEVVVLSRSRGPIEEAISLGATEADSPADLASKVDVVLTCLPMPDVIEEIYLGEEGILAGAKAGMILADHSTVGPELNRKIASRASEKGAAYLDAPISGGPMGAAAGTLAIMAGGEKEAFERVLPIFEAMGRHIVHLGPTGSGSVVKLINNTLVAVHTAALSEAFIAGAKAGISSKQLHEVLKASTGHSFMMDRVVPLIEKRDFAQRFSVKLLHKDMGLALDMIHTLEVPDQFTKLGAAKVAQAMLEGHGEEDIAAIIRPYEKETGLEVKED